MPANVQGFAPANLDIVPRIVLAIEGLEKTGKTHLALTAPGPNAFFDLDIGAEGVVSQASADGKEIVVPDPPLSRSGEHNSPDDWKRAWERFKTLYTAALASPDIRTIVVDTETQTYELVRLARFGKLAQVLPRMYGAVFQEYRDLIEAVYDSKKNAIFLRKLKPKYVNDKQTDELTPGGYGELAAAVQCNIRTWREPAGGPFHATILNSRHNYKLAGQDHTDPFISFELLAQTMLPNVPIERWS